MPVDTVRRRLVALAAVAGVIAVALFAALRGCGETARVDAEPRADAIPPSSSVAAGPARAVPSTRHRDAAVAASDAVGEATAVEVGVSRYLGELNYEPIPGATVRLRPAGGSERSATTDSTGTARFELVPSGDFEVHTTAPGYVPSDSAAGNRSRKSVVLQRGTAVTGIVVDARTGRPIAGADVEIAGGRPLSAGSEGGRLLVLPPREDAEDFRVLGRATSGADGRFDLDGVTPGQPVIVTARAAGLGSGRAGAAAPPLDKPSRPVEVRVGPTGTLSGRIFDAGGRPAAGALAGAVPTSKPDEVSALVDGGSFVWRFGSADRRIVRADGEGRWRIEGLPLDTMLTIVAKGAAAPSAAVPDVMLTAERPERSIDLKLRAFSAVIVRVLRPDGTPAEGGSVGVETSHGSWSNQAGTEHHFDQIVPGSRVVTARAPGFPPVSVKADMRAGEAITLDVRLVAGLPLSGVIVDAEGHPVAGATVRAFGPDGSGASSVTTADGKFHLAGLLLGRHRIEATHDTLGIGATDTEVVADAPSVTLTIPKNGELRVDVADAEGAPVEMAWVAITGPIRRTIFTDDKGSSSQRLPPGRYRVGFEYGGDAGSAVEVEVKAGEETVVRLRTP